MRDEPLVEEAVLAGRACVAVTRAIAEQPPKPAQQPEHSALSGDRHAGDVGVRVQRSQDDRELQEAPGVALLVQLAALRQQPQRVEGVLERFQRVRARRIERDAVDQAHGRVAGVVGVQVRRAARYHHALARRRKLLGAIHDVGRAALCDGEALVEREMHMWRVGLFAAPRRVRLLELEQLAAGLGAGLQHGDTRAGDGVGQNLSRVCHRLSSCVRFR